MGQSPSSVIGARARWHPLTLGAIGMAGSVLALSPLPLGRWTLAWPLGLFAALALTVAAIDRRRSLAWLRWTAAAWLPLAISLVMVHGLIFPEGVKVLARLGPLAVTAEGLRFAALTAARWLAVSGAVTLVAVLCPLTELAAAIEVSALPGVLSHVVASAVLLLPAARRTAESIRDAQRARGLPTAGSLWLRARALTPLVVPLATALIVDGQARAFALAVRGYAPGAVQTRLGPPPDSAAQRGFRRTLVGLAWLAAVAAHAWAAWGPGR